MTGMVERVARAIAGVPDGHLDERWLRKARAAIEAMREPTTGMCAAGGDMIWARINNDQNGCTSHAILSWRAMIDEALKE